MSDDTDSPATTPRVSVDNSLVEADYRMREGFVRAGGCADYWIGDPAACVAENCCMQGGD